MAKYSSYQVSLITGQVFESLSFNTMNEVTEAARGWNGQLRKTLVIYTMNSRNFSMPVRFAGERAQDWAALMSTIYRMFETCVAPQGWIHADA